MNVFALVQLTHAAPPAAYAHSFGIEPLARSGALSSPDSLADLVRSLLISSIAPAEGIASGIAFRAARHADYALLPDLSAALNSDRVPLDHRLASLHAGQRLWGLSRTWDWASPIHQQLDPLARPADLHHAVAFGALVSETTSSQVRAIATCLLNIARSLIDCAVRAIPLDDLEAQRVLNAVQPTLAELARACADRPPDDIVVPSSPFP